MPLAAWVMQVEALLDYAHRIHEPATAGPLGIRTMGGWKDRFEELAMHKTNKTSDVLNLTSKGLSQNPSYRSRILGHVP